MVRGGARRGTADRRGERIARSLLDHAARLSDVVDASASAGPSHDGDPLLSRRVHFDRANRGHPDWDGRRTRYLDPDHEQGLASLAEANERAAERRRADRDRRSAVDCRNTYRLTGEAPTDCRCVYCRPAIHEADRRLLAGSDGLTDRAPYCLCGRPLAGGTRCPLHRHARIVVFDGDHAALHVLAGRDQPAANDSKATGA